MDAKTITIRSTDGKTLKVTQREKAFLDAMTDPNLDPVIRQRVIDILTVPEGERERVTARVMDYIDAKKK